MTSRIILTLMKSFTVMASDLFGARRGPARRAVLAGLGAAALLPALPAHALSVDEADALIQRVAGEINAVINAGQSEARVIAEFEKIFARYCDMPIIARSALGVEARAASSAQMAAFTKAFQAYIARKYGRRFRDYAGGRLEVRSARAVKSFYEVVTVAFAPDTAPFEVVFLVSDRSGRDLFFNIIVEGVNMLTAEREEIRALLDARRGNLDQLIRDLPALG